MTTDEMTTDPGALAPEFAPVSWQVEGVVG